MIVISYVFFGSNFEQKRGELFFNQFQGANLNGEVESVGVAYHSVSLKLLNDTNTYMFNPITSELNNNKPFQNFARRGDWVTKQPYVDTLVLRKDGRSYRYVLSKVFK